MLLQMYHRVFTNQLMQPRDQASRNVRWNEKMSDSSLKDHVEYALPNLKRSPSDSKNSGKKYKKLDNYTRSFSQQTQISMLSTPGR